MRSRLYLSNSVVAIGSPASTTFCDDRIQEVSHARERRSVTPFKSGPTRSPFPYVWQPLHFLANNAAASVAASAVAGRSRGSPQITARTCARIGVIGVSRRDLQ